MVENFVPAIGFFGNDPKGVGKSCIGIVGGRCFNGDKYRIEVGTYLRAAQPTGAIRCRYMGQFNAEMRLSKWCLRNDRRAANVLAKVGHHPHRH